MTIFFSFFSKLVYIFRVRLGPLAFLGRALQLGQARGPGAARPHDFIHVLNIRCMFKIDRPGGGQKSFSRKLPKEVMFNSSSIEVTHQY